MSLILSYLVSLLSLSVVVCTLGANGEFPKNRVIPSCVKSEIMCKFHFRISYKMILISQASTHAKESVGPCASGNKTKEEYGTILTDSGRYKRVLVVNDRLPGPPIVVHKGQHVSVTIENAMETESTLMHWHGLRMKKTPWMDGAPVSHCPIGPGKLFEYKFEADAEGTHWYHSHLGQQRSLGMFGPLVILPDSRAEENSRRGKDIIPDIDGEFHMMISDWNQDSPSDIFVDLRNGAMPNRLHDGSDTGFVPAISVLINGKGEYINPGTGLPESPVLPLEVFTVKTGGHFRFRITNAASTFSYRVSIDKHNLHIITSDGSDVATTKAESLIIGTGERYDLWTDTNDPSGTGNYWIRLEALDYTNSDGKPITPVHTKAILRYEDAPVRDPESSRKECSFLRRCVVVNCPFKSYPKSERIICKYSTDLRKPVPKPTLNGTDGTGFMDKILAVNFVLPAMAINGRQFVPYGSPPQIHPVTQRSVPCHKSCDVIGCKCTHELFLKTNDIIQLTFFVPPFLGTVSAHTMHTHGYRFEVVKIGWPEYDKHGKYVKPNPDIVGSYNPKWTNSSWANGHVPGLITEGAIEKDTVLVPGGGYVVVRFKADNPGYWLLHCHMEPHSSLGMLMVLKEGESEEYPPVPPAFPTCEDYSQTDEEYLKQYRGGGLPSDSTENVMRTSGNQHVEEVSIGKQSSGADGYLILSVCLGLMLVAVTSLLAIVLYRNKRNSNGYMPISNYLIDKHDENRPLIHASS